MKVFLERIRLLLLDVDGVMTDGRIILDSRGGEAKAFDVRDGHGLKMIQRAGFIVGIITGRNSPVVDLRARELGIDLVFQGAKDKLVPFREIVGRLGLEDKQVAYFGDDLVDLPLLRRVGWAVTVSEAPEEVKAEADHITLLPGGRGAVREVCDLLLKATGKWEEVTARYFSE